jgi:D-alanyl-D-alanine carboxypeptidase
LPSGSFDDIPEAQRETVDSPTRRSPGKVVWLGVAAIGLLLSGVGIFSVTQLSNRSTTTTAPTNSDNAPDQTQPDADGRVLNHYPYKEAAQANLAPITADGTIKLHYEAAQAYKEMVAAAQAEGILLVPLSGFRSIKDQQDLFFNVSRERNQRPQERANVSAPPGHSEHHTGYAIDVGDGHVPAVNLSQDFENTEAFHWLERNAARYSFELSFPKNNEQGVSYEPWHWRYVGDSASLETFYKARNVKPKSN